MKIAPLCLTEHAGTFTIKPICSSGCAVDSFRIQFSTNGGGKSIFFCKTKIRALRRGRVVTHDNAANKELQEIKESIASDAAIKQFGWSDLMHPWVRRILFIGIGVAVATRFTGVNTIMFYGTQILTEAGFGRQIAIIATVANGSTSVIATFFGIWLLGKIGRVTMFKTGIVGTMLSLLTIALAAMSMEGSPSLPYIVLSMTIVFLFFMQGFIAPCLWLIIAEIFPLQLLALGMGIAIFMLWIFDALVGAAFPVVLDQFGLSATFFVFVFMLMIAFVFVHTCVPETKGKTLEEIEHYFRSLEKN